MSTWVGSVERRVGRGGGGFIKIRSAKTKS